MNAYELLEKITGLNSCEPVIIKACEDVIRQQAKRIEELEEQLKKDEPMKICNLIGETYQVVKNDEVFYQGSLESCESFIKVFNKR